jgi:hypothetical protein
MRLSFLFILIFLLCSTSSFAQDSLIVLHPSVGEKITLESKKKYLLFPEIRDSVFRFCEIRKKQGKYFMTTTFKNDSVSTTEVSGEELYKNQQNIVTLDEYYNSKNDSDKNSKANMNYNPSVNKNLAAPSLSEQQKMEIIRDKRLKADQERMKNYQQGRETDPVNFEIYSSGKKKK